MKKYWAVPAVLALLAALRLLTPAATDAAELLPVTVLRVRAAGDAVEVLCDAGDDACTGRGETLDAALDDLCASAPGTLFLQTAEHILITPDARHILPQAAVSRRLRPAARVYYLQGGAPELSRAGDFLRAHGGGARLTDVRARLLGAEGAPEIATLVCTQGRLTLHGS